ncbi:MAG TPA: D-alanyl-D-alanine carboxypeptidase/D-alanyl-D-alanine-endopeptidase [Solirubrobacteraceae bacterium]|nr:D-alanyl-D-alanine carboxypeptidase/D-alanyl-D-alanine-endopeptidase [Solirubrobacteraceae bacterium]
MRPLLVSLLAAATLTGAAPPAVAFDDADLQATLAGEMRHAPPASGAYVADLADGRRLYARRPDIVRIPASVEKLYTTSTALLRLGPATTLQTLAVTAPGTVLAADGTLGGDLVLVGGGDPFFGVQSAAILARAVRSAGIKRIAGAVVGDESAFDDRRSGCCAGYDTDLGGVLSALAYDRGIFQGRARLDAARFAAGRFATQLRAAGVTVAGHSLAGPAPEGARTLATVPSRSVAELARFTNVPSNNFAAEMLLKDLGARLGGSGTETAGADVVRDTLGGFGVRPQRIVDGSGLSRQNRTTPRQVVTLLQRMAEPDMAASFRPSLAVTGATGTVKARMRGTAAAGRCQVKTGTLRLVSALAGYCRTAGGRDVVFAFMTNRANTFSAKAREDRMTVAIARLGAAPGPQAAPAPPAATTTVPAATVPLPSSSGGALPPR